MLYVLYGKDTDKSRKKVNTTVEALLKKNGDAELFRIDTDSFSKDKLVELISGQGLFSSKYIVVLDNIFQDIDVKDDFLEHVKEVNESLNIFFLLEEKIDKKTLKKIEKNSQKIDKFETISSGYVKKGFNPFELSDSLGDRNKKKAWIAYQKTLEDTGYERDKVFGMIFWQVKSMLIVKKGTSLSGSKMKPFVFNKSKRSADNYTEQELVNMSKNLLRIYHESRRGNLEQESALEKFFLSL